MNKLIISLLLAVTTATASAVTADYRVVPLPRSIEQTADKKPFQLNANTKIVYSAKEEGQEENAKLLAQYIKELTGLELRLSLRRPRNNYIAIESSLKSAESPEAYELITGPRAITINGASTAGTFRGIQTLRKSIGQHVAEGETVEFPPMEINDYPEFAYRGMHLDVSRHFMTADSVKRYIDMMAIHNINRFHWHLTDDQGWRLEIKSHPELTEKGAWRSCTLIGKQWGTYDGTPHGGYYTQEQVRDIVDYAAKRHITIIPEIDLPGHMQGALAAYPELGCTGGPYEVWPTWGVSSDVLCAGNDATFSFIEDVMTEVMELFPSEYIHIGGDECPKTRWHECPKCQARIAQLGIVADDKHTAEEYLQSYVMKRVEKFLNAAGRKIIGWDEILEGGVSPSATVMSWRGESGGRTAAALGNDVIMVPCDYLYFDYYQTENTDEEPLAIGGCVTLPIVYSYNPRPDGMTAAEQSHILGVQANIWTEYIPTFRQVEYMALPRMAALSEVQWCDPTTKDYADFALRCARLTKLYDVYGYNYARHLFDVHATYTPQQPNGGTLVTLNTDVTQADVHYTLDGTEPTTASTGYSAPFSVTRSCALRAKAFPTTSDAETRTLTEDFDFNLATNRPITLANAPHRLYTFGGAPTLVDGVKGKENIRSGRWLGFVGTDLVATIDLGEPKSLTSLSFNNFVEPGAWILDARGYKLEVSNDGTNFTTVINWTFPAAELNSPTGIINHSCEFARTTPARYARVTITSERNFPEWHSTAHGNPAFIFVDEISLR
jgi:hexosaminidase